jgi:hypothetical protein
VRRFFTRETDIESHRENVRETVMESIRGQVAGIERSGFSNAGERQPTSFEIPPEKLDK